MRTPTLRDRARYRFDQLISRGPSVLIGWTALLSLALVLCVATLIKATGIAPVGIDGTSPSFAEISWMCLMRVLDGGTMGSDRGGWAFLLSMLFVTLTGLLLVSTLIGIISTMIDHRFNEMRKGRSLVVETGHTVILGWSPVIYSVLHEVALAFSKRRQPCVAILADKDRVQMEDEIQTRVVGSRGRVRFVCRTGKPTDAHDLEIVSPFSAQTIVVLPRGGANPDAEVMQTVLSLTQHPRRPRRKLHIVTEMSDSGNAALLRTVADAEVHYVVTSWLTTHLMAQTVCQPGLVSLYDELLSFEGNDIYFAPVQDLAGHPFEDSLHHFTNACPIGMYIADGRVCLNPPGRTLISKEDQLIVISAEPERSRLRSWEQPSLDLEAIHASPIPPSVPLRILILRWNLRGLELLSRLDRLMARGSHVTVVACACEVDGANLTGPHLYKNFTLDLVVGDPLQTRTLDPIDLASYDRFVLLTDSRHVDGEAADIHTLLTLFQLRERLAHCRRQVHILTELLNPSNRALGEAVHLADFVVAPRFSSLLLAQLSQNPEITHVCEHLLSPGGANLCFREMTDYLTPGRSVNFHTLIEAARTRGEIAVGYSRLGRAGERLPASLLNPVKDELVAFEPGDRLIVIASEPEEESTQA